MKRNHLITSLAALTMAFLLPIAATAGTITTAKSTTAASNTAAKSASIMPHHHAKAAAVKTQKLNLNTASREELMTLPDVDGAKADKIIENRPYKSMNELTSKNVMSKGEFTKVRRKVTAK
jgi:DNA uptake protein ComE-like DNA-binding protein